MDGTPLVTWANSSLATSLPELRVLSVFMDASIMARSASFMDAIVRTQLSEERTYRLASRNQSWPKVLWSAESCRAGWVSHSAMQKCLVF